jgi:hypothetical protein
MGLCFWKARLLSFWEGLEIYRNIKHILIRDVIKDDFGGKLPSGRPPASAFTPRTGFYLRTGFYRPPTQ